MSQAQAMRSQIKQLKQEASVQRVPVSKACHDLMEYCNQHQATDGLVTGIPQSENPFKETKGCTLL
ncbi:hypothetical protein RvY_09793 [Ramazzottius varieornatus]|uniref:Guanine nucleotide-binding protein subunit gamma n=1 Tax=Ramazzottius varieornatus TaxID=947166 RepID=A0A1D1VAK6_RAMVA|nr:hypothetical protein RvY_09793 [Ramazzottius varieornatus]